MMAIVYGDVAARLAAQAVEIQRLRDILWCDGDPGTINDYTQPECFFCGDRDDSHEDGCVWLAEEERRILGGRDDE